MQRGQKKWGEKEKYGGDERVDQWSACSHLGLSVSCGSRLRGRIIVSSRVWLPSHPLSSTNNACAPFSICLSFNLVTVWVDPSSQPFILLINTHTFAVRMQARNVCRRFKEYSYLFPFYTLMYCVLIRCSLAFEIPLQRASIRNKYPLLKVKLHHKSTKEQFADF